MEIDSLGNISPTKPKTKRKYNLRNMNRHDPNRCETCGESKSDTDIRPSGYRECEQCHRGKAIAPTKISEENENRNNNPDIEHSGVEKENEVEFDTQQESGHRNIHNIKR